MREPRKLWMNEKWYKFSQKVKNRDGYKCLQCGRGKSEAVLQVHHDKYIINKAPWEYPLSNCLTLCKGCHAKEHNIIEPDKGWTLISIDDLGDLIGTCERDKCGSSIRYEHLTYHPSWGYKIVGSTCIEHLTQKDRLLSNNIIKTYKNISSFVHNSEWDAGFTQKNKKYIATKYKHHTIRIYGENNNYSFQIAIKEKGIKWHDFHKIIRTKNKTIDEVKELSFIVLKGTISSSEKEKIILRDLYKKIK